MVHNGIEYGLMAAYAEGLNILKHANASKSHREADAETTPLRNPEHYQYDFNLADITEVWRRGSVVASWLLDLAAISLLEQPTLERFSGRVSDSGEGRWTLLAAIESTAPAPVRSEEHTSELQSQSNLVCRLLLEKKKKPHIHSLPRQIRVEVYLYFNVCSLCLRDHGNTLHGYGQVQRKLYILIRESAIVRAILSP